MKSWKIILPSLIATSSLPLVSLVSCGAKAVNLSLWDSIRTGLRSELIEDMPTGTEYHFSIDMKNNWRGSKQASKYDYLTLDLVNGEEQSKILCFDTESVQFYIDGEKVDRSEISFKDGFVYFLNEEIQRHILRCSKITGSFVSASSQGTTSSSVSVEFRGQEVTPEPTLWISGLPNNLYGTYGKPGSSDTIILWYITAEGGRSITDQALVNIKCETSPDNIGWAVDSGDGLIYWNDQSQTQLEVGDYPFVLEATYAGLKLEKHVTLHIQAE